MTKFNFIIDPKKTIDTFNLFLDSKNYFYKDLSRDIFADHPKLKDSSEDINNYVWGYYQSHWNQVITYQKNITKRWKNKWPKLQDILSNLLNTGWSGIDKIYCNIGIAKIYPRYLNTYEFQICHLDPMEFSEGVITHEVTHFLYFKKWKELFPKDKPSSFEAPHPIWHLSEITAPILNSDKKVLKLIPRAVTQSYSEHNKLIERFREIYKESKTIEDYLKSARKEILKTNLQ